MSYFQLTETLDNYGMLWLAVLRQAVDDATAAAKSVEAVADKTAALAWIASKVDSIGSLHWVCDVLGIDPDDVRYEYDSRVSRGGFHRRKKVLGGITNRTLGRVPPVPRVPGRNI